MIWIVDWAEAPYAVAGILLIVWFISKHFSAKNVPEHFDAWRKAHRDAISKEGLKYNRAFLDRKRNVKKFPPPYPNTWYYALRSTGWWLVY